MAQSASSSLAATVAPDATSTVATDANGKGKVFLDTTPVTVDGEDFDRWVGTIRNSTMSLTALLFR